MNRWWKADDDIDHLIDNLIKWYDLSDDAVDAIICCEKTQSYEVCFKY